MRFLPEFLGGGRVYEPRPSEMAAARALPVDVPFLPPNIDLTFFYGLHTSSGDFRPLISLLAGADVFIPEITAWKMDHIAYYSRISQGDRKAQKEWEVEEGQKVGEYTSARLNAIRGSGLRITAIDYSALDPKAEQIENHFASRGLLDKVVPSWRETLSNIIRFAQAEAELESYREDGMSKSIGPRLQTLITEDPDLSQKDRVKVVVQQGEAHGFYYPKFEALAAQVESVTIQSVFRRGEHHRYEHIDQLAHALRGEGPRLTQQQKQELAMRALGRVGLRFNKIPWVRYESDNRGLIPYIPPPDEMVERFTVDHIKKFHRELVEAQGLRVKK